MARDLAKVDTPLRAQPQRTFRRETTMPRQATDLPERGVFTDVRRPANAGANAEALAKILGLATDVGGEIYGQIQQKKNNEDDAQALLDYSTGHKDDEKFAKSRAYRDRWQLEGAKNLAVTIGNDVTEKFNERLNDPDNPPTIDDMDALFESTIKSHLVDEHGQPLDFITPDAKKALGIGLSKLKLDLMPKAADAIKLHQDTQLMSTMFSNQMVERQHGQPIDALPGQAPDPLAPLPEGQKEPAKKTKKVSFGEPTGRLPIQGAITSTMAQHIARGSHGVDIDGRMGDPVSAPAGGTVTVGRDARSGLFVKIDHGNGVVSSYAHLSGTSLKTGDVIQSGQTLGLVGNSGHAVSKTGDGSHLHWRVKVNGKDVNPLAFNFKGGGAATVELHTGYEPELASELPQQNAGPGFNIEEFMSKLPPSIDKGQAKTWVLQAVIAEAARTNDPSLLDGLAESKRKDGTPSLNPAEQLKITEVQDQIANRARTENERKVKELQDHNRDLVLEAFNSGNYPSEAWLADQGSKGLLDDGFVFTAINHVQAEQDRQAREISEAQKAAEKAEDESIDIKVESMAIRRQAGDLSHSSYDEDLKLLQSGALGHGADAMKRFSKLQSAARSGASEAEKSPGFAYFSGKLKEQYGPKSRSSGNGSLLLTTNSDSGALPKADFDAMMAHFGSLVRSGKSPEEAYRSSVANYGPRSKTRSQAINDRIAELRRKQRGE